MVDDATSAAVLPDVGTLPADPASRVLKRRRRTGKVACLPNAIREQINRMIHDGVRYRLIIENLHGPATPPLPYEISEHHLSEWKDGGYQDWLNDQFWREEMRDRHQAFSGLLAGNDAIQLPEGGLQLAAIGLCELLRDLSALNDNDRRDPDKCVRVANSLARISRSMLQLQQYRDACTKARTALHDLKDPNRKLNERETRAIVRKVDEILGFSSPEDDENDKFRISSDVREGEPSIAKD
jgi:hypothetical protein